MKKRAWFSNLLKVLISVVALAWVLMQIPFAVIWDVVKSADIVLLVVVYLLMIASLLVRAGRWHVLLSALGAGVKFNRLVELYFVGNFFNSFLPSGFGGDVVRAAEITRDVEPGAAVGTVILDRLAGLMVLFIFALAALPFSAQALPPSIVWPLAGIALIGLAASFLLLEGNLLRRLCSIFERYLPEKIAALLSPSGSGPVGKVYSAVTGCGKMAMLKALAVSAVFNTMLIFWWYLAGRAIHIFVSPWVYVSFVPVLSLALMVPSIGGLGVREGLSSLLFASVGVSEPEGVALSLVLFVLNRFAGIVGGFVYLASSLKGMQGRNDSP
ncbi:MAG: flippase-like domain-containing protein [Anaerolineales bacterium]|nr:flippase-like domain-containing protein [Anaerolineales bacterium]